MQLPLTDRQKDRLERLFSRKTLDLDNVFVGSLARSLARSENRRSRQIPRLSPLAYGYRNTQALTLIPAHSGHNSAPIPYRRSVPSFIHPYTYDAVMSSSSSLLFVAYHSLVGDVTYVQHRFCSAGRTYVVAVGSHFSIQRAPSSLSPTLPPLFFRSCVDRCRRRCLLSPASIVRRAVPHSGPAGQAWRLEAGRRAGRQEAVRPSCSFDGQ